jgi:hypothetical protein
MGGIDQMCGLLKMGFLVIQNLDKKVAVIAD